MIKTGLIAVVVAAGLLLACSKTETQPSSVNSSPPPVQEVVDSITQPLDYKLICERLIALVPEARQTALAANCVTDYQSMLPSCQNAFAVNACYSNMTEWSGRLACLDSCVRK
jgi:hypothetical protein